MKQKFHLVWKNRINRLLFLALIVSIVYAIVKIIISPADFVISPDADYHIKVKGDYVLMLLQCILGLIVMAIPGFIEKKINIDIPDSVEIIYFIFLFMAIILGEVRNFYYLIPHWDTVLHTFSGMMLGALGFHLVTLLNSSEHIHFHLSPFFIAFFSFCFAVTAGVTWEIYEFLIDGIFRQNMQKFAFENGVLLIGRAALVDTMKDLIVDALSALVVAVIGYIDIKNNGMNIRNDTIRKNRKI